MEEKPVNKLTFFEEYGSIVLGTIGIGFSLFIPILGLATLISSLAYSSRVYSAYKEQKPQLIFNIVAIVLVGITLVSYFIYVSNNPASIQE